MSRGIMAVPQVLILMNLVRIKAGQPFLSLGVSLNTTELRDKVATYLRVISEIDSVARLVD